MKFKKLLCSLLTVSTLSGTMLACSIPSSKDTEIQDSSNTTSVEFSDQSSTSSVAREPIAKRTSKFASSLFSSTYSFNNFNVNVVTGGKNIQISSSNLSLDMRSASLGLSGSINIKVGEIDETLSIYFDKSSGKIVIGYQSDFYTFTVDGTNEVLALINKFIPSVPETIPGLSEIYLAFTVLNGSSSYMNTLLKPSAVENEDGTITFELDLSSILNKVGISGKDFGKIILVADENNKLSSLSSSSVIDLTKIMNAINGSSSEESSTLSINATVEESSKDETLVKDIVSDENNLVNLNALDGTASSLSHLIDSKAFTTNFEINLNKSNVSSPINAKGVISADLNSSSTDWDRGTYYVSVESGEFFNNPINVTYIDQSIYIDAEPALKGKTTVSSLRSIYETLKEFANDETSKNAIDSIDKILSSDLFKSIFEDEETNTTEEESNETKQESTETENTSDVKKELVKDGLSNQYNSIKEKISYMETTESSINLGISSSLLNFAQETTIGLKLNLDHSEKKNKIKEIELTSIPVDATSTIDVKLGDLKSIEEGSITVNEEEYVDYSGLSTIASDLSKIIKNKQISVDYSLAIEGIPNFGDGSLALSGELRGDLNTNSLYLDANFEKNEKEHNINAYYQNETVYASYDSVFKNSITNTTSGKVYDVISQRLGIESVNLKDTETIVNDITTSLKEKIFDEDGSLNFDKIHEYFYTTKENDVAKFYLNSSLLGYELGTLEIIFNTTENKFEGITVSGIQYNDMSFSFSLKFKDYEEKLINVEEYPDVGDITQIATGVFDLYQKDLKQYGVSVQGSIVTDEGKEGSLTGKIKMDVDNNYYAGHIVADTDPDNTYSDYQYDLLFSYNDEEQKVDDDQDGIKEVGQLYAMYNNQLGIRVKDKSLKDVVEQIQNVPETNLLYDYISMGSMLGTMPVAEISSSGDYSKFLNDYIKQIKFSDGNIVVSINPSFLGLSGENDIDISINYSDNAIKSVEVNNALISGNTVSFKIELAEYDSVLTDSDKIDYTQSFIDFDNISTFTSIGINTTNNKSLVFSGTLDMNGQLLGFINAVAINDKVDFEFVAIQDEVDKQKIQLQTRIVLQSLDDGKVKTVTTYNILPNGDAIILNKNSNNQITALKATGEEIKKNIFYYFFALGLNLTDGDVSMWYPVILTNVEKSVAESSSTETKKGGFFNTGLYPEKIIKSATYDETNRNYTLGVDLSSIDTGSSAISLANDVNISVTHDENNNLDTLSLNKESIVSIASVVTLDATLKVSRDTTATEEELISAYNNNIAYYNNNIGENEGYFEITDKSFNKKWYLPYYSSTTYTNNGKWICKTSEEDINSITW